MRKNTKRFGAVIGVAACAVAMSACRYTGFADAPSKSTASAATDWLLDQQESDGGFELANFTGFETSDAILAIAENAQQQAEWNTTQARNAVRAAETNGNDPLHNIDDLVDDNSPAINAGTAAKVIVLVAKPLGLAMTNFNPDGDTGKNLVAVMNAGAAPNGSYGTFNATAYAALAKKLVDGSVPTNTVAYIRAAQEASGGWDFNGDPARERRRRRQHRDRDPGARGGGRRGNRPGSPGRARVPREPPAVGRCVGGVRQRGSQLDIGGDLRRDRGRVQSGEVVLARRRRTRARGQRIHVADGLAAVAAEPRRADAGRRGPDQQPERRVRREHVRHEPVDPGTPAGMEPDHPAVAAGLPVVARKSGADPEARTSAQHRTSDRGPEVAAA